MTQLKWNNIQYRQIDDQNNVIPNGDTLDFPVTQLQSQAYGPTVLRLYVSNDEGNEIIAERGYAWDSGAGCSDGSRILNSFPDGLTYTGVQRFDSHTVDIRLNFTDAADSHIAVLTHTRPHQLPFVRRFTRSPG